MVKTSDRIGKPFVVIMEGVKMLVTAVKIENSLSSPCASCVLRGFRIIGSSQHPRNCQRIAPSCMAHKRKDNNSIVYKKIDHADEA
ncbi:hypothetical protein [uncultured Butyricimonas sp.]|uniref:hypothetical protein n=1 Tax=uncultured Butyricimonas sp. TaxID=1268785 RepID=UPI0026DD6D3E|nr:hypothetical protein [uncultured Butyricimonas sp.]